MRIPFVLRSRYQDLYERYQLALKATVKAREKADPAHFNRRQVLMQNAALDADNRRLNGRVLELGRRLAALADSDPECTARLKQRVDRLQQVGVRILAAYAVEKQRADRLASYLDSGDLDVIKRWEARVTAHNAWASPIGRDAIEGRPVDGGSGRPTHPAVELRRAQRRCLELEARLAVAEGRKWVAS